MEDSKLKDATLEVKFADLNMKDLTQEFPRRTLKGAEAIAAMTENLAKAIVLQAGPEEKNVVRALSSATLFLLAAAKRTADDLRKQAAAQGVDLDAELAKRRAASDDIDDLAGMMPMGQA